MFRENLVAQQNIIPTRLLGDLVPVKFDHFGGEKLVSCTFLEQYKSQPLPKEIQFQHDPESSSCHNLAICRPR